VRVFVIGANTWREAEDWPIPGTRFTNYYLRSQGQANSMYGNGQLATEPPSANEPPDRYVYDPANPVPSKGGHSCCFHMVAPVGPYDQSDVEKRADVLVYSTAPLTEAVEVTGPISVTLYAASSAADTDWTAKLVDVHPDGKVINLNNGIIRASHRNSLEASEPIEPGKVYEYTITVFPTTIDQSDCVSGDALVSQLAGTLEFDDNRRAAHGSGSSLGHRCPSSPCVVKVERKSRDGHCTLPTGSRPLRFLRAKLLPRC
jgi:putative CocE/NonD family hydrolase